MLVTKENGYSEFAGTDAEKEFLDKAEDKGLNSINKKRHRIGVAKGKISIPDDFDEMDKEIEEMFDLQ